MKPGRKVTLTRQTVLDIISSPEYLACSVMALLSVAVSMLPQPVSGRSAGDTDDTISLFCSFMVTVISLIIPCGMIWLRLRPKGSVLHGLSACLKAVYYLYWLMLLVVLAMMATAVWMSVAYRYRMPDGTMFAKGEVARFFAADAVRSDYVSFLLRMLLLRRLYPVTDSAAPVLDGRTTEILSARPAETVALIAAVYATAYCIYSCVQGDYTRLFGTAQRWLLWLMLRKAAAQESSA